MFGSEFNEKQIQALVLLFNDEGVFVSPVDRNRVSALLSCRHTKPIMVKDVRKLCYVMDLLSRQSLISPLWQSIADKNKCFVSIRGNHISRNMFSSAKYRAVNESLRYFNLDKYMQQLKKLK